MVRAQGPTGFGWASTASHPHFVVVSGLGTLDAMAVLVIPGVASAFQMLFIRQFYPGVPVALEGAAMTVGVSRRRILTTFFLPKSRAPFVVVGVAGRLLECLRLADPHDPEPRPVPDPAIPRQLPVRARQRAGSAHGRQSPLRATHDRPEPRPIRGRSPCCRRSGRPDAMSTGHPGRRNRSRRCRPAAEGSARPTSSPGPGW